MASAQEVQNELNGIDPSPNRDIHAALMHAGGPKGLQHVARSVQDKVTHAAKEITLWLGFRSLSDLRKRRRGQVNEGRDTTLGHAINAASASLLALEVALRVAEKLDVDLSGIDGLDE